MLRFSRYLPSRVSNDRCHGLSSQVSRAGPHSDGESAQARISVIALLVLSQLPKVVTFMPHDLLEREHELGDLAPRRAEVAVAL